VSGFIPAARPLIGEEEVSAVSRVLRSGELAQGPEVAAFEEEFAARFAPGRAAVAVSSGTAALHLGLLASGVGPGDEVIVPSFTFAAVANAVALTGAKPVFADIEAIHFTIRPDAVRAALTSRTVGVIPVHLYGHPADMGAIQDVADQHGIAVFEDAAQAHGATWNGMQVGSFGRFGIFSLYPTKNMTSGEGGMVTSRDPEVLRAVRLLRNQGMERRYENEVIGFNLRMTDIHAAIGRAQLRKVDAWTQSRRRNAAYFDDHLQGVVIPAVANEASHVYHQYTIRVDDRDRFVKALAEEHGVGSGVYYPTPIHHLRPYRSVTADLPETDRAAAEVVSLPVHPSLGSSDLERIVAAVNLLARAGR
jgi:perosamine synthetase